MSATLKDSITEAMKNAMRAKDKERLGTIRLMLAEFKRIEVDERIEVDDARGLVVLDKMVKQRRDSASQFSNANRKDLADKELAEIAVIQEFMPSPFSEEELSQLVSDAVAESGASSAQDMGKVMAILKPKVQGRADMGQVGQLVKKSLSA
ncbi:MAG: GatB/YqeY domain-containing protein [Hahellaceae bacterium]|nr:GatB/YqeY domain-containing protein [Hahellaceae bacterium]MCP5168486.1 GatB/YqeY domain-containing protein [Hahellaceae bacterium]